MSKNKERNRELKRQFNSHHCYPSSRHGLTNDINCQLLNVLEHDNWHRVFVNATCVEQLCKVLIMNKKVWSDKFKEDIIDVLENHLNNYYRDKVRSWFDKQEVKNVLDLETKLYDGRLL